MGWFARFLAAHRMRMDWPFNPVIQPGESADRPATLLPGETLQQPGRWRALPGNRIALQATGFEIELLTTGDGCRPYRLFTPEGGLLAWGGDLQGLKKLAEKQADDRAEFSLPAAARKP